MLVKDVSPPKKNSNKRRLENQYPFTIIKRDTTNITKNPITPKTKPRTRKESEKERRRRVENRGEGKTSFSSEEEGKRKEEEEERR